jgi:hypothetical protein
MDTMKRGRPPKFGRPGKLVALTLPEDVVDWLQAINPDPAWAIVSLFERQHDRRTRAHETARADVELVSIGPRRALIVVSQEPFGAIQGVSAIPMGAGRAFLALESGKGMADLELAVVDRLDERGLSDAERRGLASLRDHLRAWRHDKALACTTRSIIVVEGAKPAVGQRARAPRRGKS